MEVQDVPAICDIARRRDVVTLLDNTWATPLFFRAIPAGVDISVLAATKYVGGHADVMIGAATATKTHFDRLQRTAWDLGHAVSPDGSRRAGSEPWLSGCGSMKHRRSR